MAADTAAAEDEEQLEDDSAYDDTSLDAGVAVAEAEDKSRSVHRSRQVNTRNGFGSSREVCW